MRTAALRSRVLVKDADLTTVPMVSRRAWARCWAAALVKTSKDRLRDIGEARLALRDAAKAAAPTPS